MTRTTSIVVLAAFAVSLSGCFGGRPKEIASQPGDCFCELSDLRVTNVNGELTFKVHYEFPDGMPKHEAYFTCTFELQGANTSSVKVTKQGSELARKGDFEGKTNASFLRSASGSLSIQVRQGEKKTGPFRPVSPPLVASF